MFKNFFPNKILSLNNNLISNLLTGMILVILVGLIYALFISPPDYIQGDSVRIMYVHVPASFIALGCFGFIGIASILNLIFKIKSNISTEIINTISHVKRSWLEISLINWIFLIFFPIITDVNKIGVKPMKVAKRKLNFGIPSNDKMMFCIISGRPGTNRKIIRYSNVEWEIYLLIFWTYFS